MSSYTQITDYDKTGMTQDTIDATDALVADMNQIYADAYNLGLSKEDLDYAISVMVGDSSSTSLKGLMDIIGVLTVECNSIAGALVGISDVMNIISDTTNLMSTAMNSYTNLADGFSEYTTPEEAKNSAYYNDTSDKGAEYDLETFDSSINVFLSTTFYVNGEPVDGLLNLLSNPDYWGGTYAPMTDQTAALITTSIEGIEGTFGTDWVDSTNGSSDYTAMMDDVIKWSEPKVYTDASGNPSDPAIYGSYTQNADIEQDMNSVDDQLTTTTSTLQNYESEGMALYQQFQAYEEDDIQSIKDQQATMISNQLA